MSLGAGSLGPAGASPGRPEGRPEGGPQTVLSSSTPPPPPGATTLVLVPTELELRRLADQGGLARADLTVELAGFGPIAAAARAAVWIERLRPARVVLVGIAGTFEPERLAVGTATTFARVALDGVGVGQGVAFRGPPALGFPQFPRAASAGLCVPAIGDTLELDGLPREERPAAPVLPLLLTTCAASASPEEAAVRRGRHPDALAEDMEAFGVALAATLAAVPVSVVRGISNVVGDRDSSRWRITAALAAARTRLFELLEDEGP